MLPSVQCEKTYPGLASVNALRDELSAYLAGYPEFLFSLAPVEVKRNAPEIVQAMARAAQTCGVGPMATALANLPQTPANMPRVMEQAETLAANGLDGVLAQCCGQIGVWGWMDLVCLE